MKKSLVVLSIILMSCSSSMHIRDSFQKSVVITTKNGEAVEGTVVDIADNTVIFINGKTKQSMKIKESDILSVEEAENFYDSKGYAINDEHISKYKSSSNTFLYSFLGTIGGGLIGGLTYGLIANKDAKESDSQETKNKISDDNKSNIITGAIIGALGGGTYGAIVGHHSDVKKAVDKVRLRREALRKIQKEKKN